MKALHMVSFILVVVGALNWGFIGLFNVNLLSMLGVTGGMANTVYILVGLSGLYLLLTHKDDCGMCAGMMMEPKKTKKRK